MIESHYDWDVKGVNRPTEAAKQLGTQLDINPVIAQILIHRGYTTVDEASAFLNPGPEQLHDPMLMHDMQRGVERIEKAISEGNQITVYGDYDADGVTSTAILVEALEQMGAQVNYYVPNRFTDGYGPNSRVFEELIQAGTELIVTVDNGVAGNEAISVANEHGVDVVVTDHHEMPETLPDAYAIIHPRHPEGSYPFGDLSGAGVAFKVATALLDEIPQEMLDLAAIGTVGDLVSLTRENRVLVSFGLKLLAQDERPGLIALMKNAGVDAHQITEQTIGFTIAPRLNALGRMKDAKPAVELLTTLDPDQAQELADQTEKTNQERQGLVNKISDEALQIANDEEHVHRQALVIAGHHWHEGVLGIVASHVVEATGKPTLILNLGDDGRAKGSGRSVPAFNLFAALDPHRDLMVAFGGHHMAVGLTVMADQLDELAQALDAAADEQDLKASGKQSLTVAAEISVSTATMEVYQAVQRLAPFGPANPEPLFEFSDASLQNVKAIGSTGSHLKFELTEGQQRLSAIDFGAGQLASDLTANSDDAQIVGALGTNTWKGKTSLQLMVKDIATSGITIIDSRTSALHQQMFDRPGIYVFFHESLYEQLQGYIKEPAISICIDGQVLTQPIPDDQPIILVDCPDSTDDLKSILAELPGNEIALYLYKKQPVSLLGMPERSEYAKLFKFVETHQNIDITHQMGELSQFLGIQQAQLVFMIQVFFELGFVTISAGKMTGVKHPEKKALSSAPSYQLREEQVKTEQALLFSDGKQLIARLKAIFKGH
ncbi:single-stranded-DNA-specific exonuclease RecJ [Levilactobacillus bambusae]|uniref:Single-stranded-DNA-specific exonuclease RecJ n=1 Tax=Levilactobacillus bambusae TaxID=2024736 RepID=A0A2V1N0D5_9LACO|nr:single-stranded-DNA-specific exonuclease RecJ [Levilactobacillus bambusae]PWG00697.1 single-stranded-DNA-specific exonuclease RecJ [Levilactobacillus bambusae]